MKKLLAASFLLPTLLVAQKGLDPTDILKPLIDDWTSYSGDLTGKRYSALKQINAETVKNLSLKWISTGITTGCGPTGAPPSDGGGGFGGGRGRGGPIAPPAPIIVGGFGTGEANNCGTA